MERTEQERQYDTIGGKTILGKIFAYQEKTGMSYEEVLRLPYIAFVLGMLDAPHINYDKKTEKTITPKTAEEEANAIAGALN